MKDIKKDINTVIKTGKICMGSREVISALLTGNPKLVIISNNCPNDVKERILYYSKLSKTRCSVTENDSIEFGSICGKPFPVSTIGILNEGESNILTKFKKEIKR